ncbi:hypothetical protein T4E_8827 [Trichinella pseudospiralis]|uniref:Uncharacterized protein n=1 Tax=Trichinella pseudospiralis TaxID=6337 RepID=A0A0V0Y3C9_TRIPS|nr:hypothetical protein T4E_8827 [Trichinella pseudospiralis]
MDFQMYKYISTIRNLEIHLIPSVSDERLKSTVGCSDNISSLFMVALGAGTTQNVQAADAVVSYVPEDSWSLLWSGTLVLWSLLCSHTARSGFLDR